MHGLHGPARKEFNLLKCAADHDSVTYSDYNHHSIIKCRCCTYFQYIALMIRIFLYKVLFAVLLVLLLTSCYDIETDLYTEAAITGEVQRNIGGVLKFKKIAKFRWTKVLILGPYSDIGQVQKELGVNLRPIEHSGISCRDDINQVVFFDDDKIVKMTEYPRSRGDFKQEPKPGFYSRDNAIFRILPLPQNARERLPWIVLEKAID